MAMFRRLEAVVVSAAVTPCLALAAVYRHPHLAFKIWLFLDLAVFIARVSLVFHVFRRQKHNKIGWLVGPWATDLYIICGTVWSALWGFGTLIINMTGDGPLMMTATFAGSAILAALSVRNPTSPRQNTVQMTLILLPFSIGCFLSATPLISWYIVLGPLYLLTLINMTRQIHDDYTAMIVAQLENRQRALHCSLTGLANRGCFYENLSEALLDRAVSKNGLAVLSIDLDGFKPVNDNYGHPLGDALLTQVGQRLRDLIRDTDMVARLGGDEFAILMRTGDRSEAERLAARINGAIAEPFVLSPHAIVTIGASIGLTVIEAGAGAVDADRVMIEADRALYEAKHAGKGTFRRRDAEGLEGDAKAPLPKDEWRMAG